VTEGVAKKKVGTTSLAPHWWDKAMRFSRLSRVPRVALRAGRGIMAGDAITHTSASSAGFDVHTNIVENFLHGKLTDPERLMLYGLYKQATVGDSDKSGWSFSPKELLKRNAWLAHKGMTSDEAKTKYVELTISLVQRVNDQLPET
tara:strand:- start:1012 stop:1449 length:438 start_codon:yes stop_codon:yes gene_type:complete